MLLVTDCKTVNPIIRQIIKYADNAGDITEMDIQIVSCRYKYSTGKLFLD